MPHSFAGALCAPVVADGFDPWFSEDQDEQAYARTLCNRCPAQIKCLLHGLMNMEKFGIFGGLDEHERKQIRPTINKLPTEVLVYLDDSYHVVLEERPEYATPSVEAKYRRRHDRAQFCMDRLIEQGDTVPHYDLFFEVCEAVLDNPTGTGKALGKTIGKSGAMFNQRLRECFEYFGCDLSVL